jgi:hypothetical protein
MKKFRIILVAVLISVFAASIAMAVDYQSIGTQDGVEIMVSYNPFGYNNLIVAFIKFVNTNTYKVDIDWTPIISCEGFPIKKGYGAPFTLNGKKSYEVTVWRSQACGHADLKSIRVEMHVKKEGY